MGTSIIIIGAGAAGLQAGRRLSKEGNKVTILEANSVPGGRIVTLPSGGRGGFSVTVEGGAEFIHGDLPLSLELAAEAGVALEPMVAHMMRVKADQSAEFTRGWDELYKQMELLPEDMPFADFLALYFSGDQYAALRDGVSRMAEGYDLADLRTASTKSLYREWAAEDEGGEEYRPAGGYGRLIDHLVHVCEEQGCVIRYSALVVSVSWSTGRVEVGMADGSVYSAELLVSTVSLGVLKDGGIRFSPDLPGGHVSAIGRLGFGSVIKVLLEFDQPFWDQWRKPGQTLFILSDEAVPTWWTQGEDGCPVITGWVSADRMRNLQRLDMAARVTSALGSLAGIFQIDITDLRSRLKASMILDWATAPAVHGGYSFEVVGAGDARSILSQPVEGTLFFAGEGLYEGDVPGTVEAAFCSGVTVAERIMTR